MRHPEFPEPIGVFRDIDRPTYDEMINSQVDEAVSEKGAGELQNLFYSGETWQVD
jgi:2-oxoglutarate ferredoxin oxidoreductase subunit beta